MTREMWKATAFARTPIGAATVGAFILIVGTAILAPPLLSGTASLVNTDAIQQGSSPGHPFGTDPVGRDILARVLVATRLSVLLATLAAGTGASIGIVWGALPSILGRRSGRLIAGAIGTAVGIPGLLLALFVETILGVSGRSAVLAIGLALAPVFARFTQTLVASVAGSDYVAAARILGVNRFRILTRYLLPNVAEALIVNLASLTGVALLALAGLSFLGLGVQPPGYDWGRMLGEGLSRIFVTPVAALAPGAAIVFAGLTFTLIGEVGAGIASRRPTGQRGHAPSIASDAGEPHTAARKEALLSVFDLSVSFPTQDGWVRPVQGVTFSLLAGEKVAMVGESGCGKTLTALSIAQLIPPTATVTGSIRFLNHDLEAESPNALRPLLGTALAMIFQNPMASLNPARRVGRQLAEVGEVHLGLEPRSAMERAVAKLRAVRIPHPELKAHSYPWELSGGQQQRSMIAMGLMGEPKLIIADEPTTALDVTVQRQVLDVLTEVTERTGAALLLISHDLSLVAEFCDRIVVMYAGRIVEDMPADRLADAGHPYTRALLETVPTMTTDRSEPLVTIPGRPPGAHDVVLGCPFRPRCRYATAQCEAERPPLRLGAVGHLYSCWNPQSGVSKPSDEAARRIR